MWDFGRFGSISFDLKFVSQVLSIVLIDLILAGDNAVVIALAVRSLPRKQRMWGMILGAGAAVLLRVVLTFFAAQLLTIRFLKLAGGILITWVAVKLFMQGTEERKIGEAANLWQAIRLIVLADLIMSTDNVLAVAGASHGNLFLLIFGLIVSIPFVVGTSTLLSMMMDKYPIIIYIGSAVLGKVAGDMIITDPWVHQMLHPPKYLEYAVMAVFAVGVIVAGKLLARWKENRDEKPPEVNGRFPVAQETAQKAKEK
ncbi:MAG TPA: TerC family protein [Thermoanaerobaculia bacterium]|nr:TerC family protein [Thermoanaerobaculia bacterium]